jgi:hypothetical protein
MAIRIDVHPVGENPTNTTCTLPTLVHIRQRTLPAGGPRTWQSFASHQQRWTNPNAPKKKGSRHNPQPDWVICRSATQFLSQHSHWSCNESQTFVDSRLLGLPGPYHWHAIGTFNTCSRVPTPRSLTDTSGGYHIENLRTTTALSPPFPSEGSNDPPNGPVRYQIIQTTITHLTGEENKP